MLQKMPRFSHRLPHSLVSQTITWVLFMLSLGKRHISRAYLGGRKQGVPWRASQVPSWFDLNSFGNLGRFA